MKKLFFSGLICLFGFVLLAPMLTFSSSALAAGYTLRLDDDTNSRIVVENAIINGDETTILFWTWPYRNDPSAGKECPMNFYSVTLNPGLTSVKPARVASGVCGGITAKGSISKQGEALIIARDRLELWRDGDRISSDAFSTFDATAKLGVSTDHYGAQHWAIAPPGNLVTAIPAGGYIAKDWPGTSLIMTSQKADGHQRWQVEFSDIGETFSIDRLWAERNGAALLYITVHTIDGMTPISETQLRLINPTGKQSIIKLMETETPFDMQSIRPGSEEDLKRFREYQKNARPESIKTLGAQPREGGGFDVLFHRKGGTAGRAGHFLQRFGPDGSLQSEVALGSKIVEHGLEKWFEFYVSGDQLILLSRVMATQHNVNSKRKRWMQSVVSWVDLDSGKLASRLIPLDTRYLEAAMNSGDEGRQYLEGQPGGDPAMLTSVGGVPLAVGIGWLKGRNTLRLNEATDDLLAFTEFYDSQQKKVAKEQTSKQRKADREARKRQMNADLAKSVGMTPEDFAALSNKQRKEIMLRQGDPAAMQAMMKQQAQAVQQGMPAQQPGMPAGMNTQLAQAMAQAQQQMDSDPNMTPQMRAQMAAIMAQMGQVQGAGSNTSSGMPSEQSTVKKGGSVPSLAKSPTPENSLELDAGQRGFLEYESEDGAAMTLLIQNRENRKELLKKNYPDGSIYEYIDFSQFGLPLEKISVTYRQKNGEVLKELTPVIMQ